MDLALNNLRRLISHKTQTNKQTSISNFQYSKHGRRLPDQRMPTLLILNSVVKDYES